MKMKDGMINVYDDNAKKLGFTSDLFDGYLWKQGDKIIISLITSLQPRKGNLNNLFSAIESNGYKVSVPTPLGLMEAILSKKGFVKNEVFDADFGATVELWEKP